MTGGAARVDGDKVVAVDFMVAVVLVASAAYALIRLIPENTQPAMSEHDVAPGFFPSLAAFTVLALSLGLLAHRVLRRPKNPTMLSGRVVLVEAAIWSGLSAAVIAGLSWLGFLPTAITLIALGMLAAGCRNWILLGAVSVLFPLIVSFGAWSLFTVELP